MYNKKSLKKRQRLVKKLKEVTDYLEMMYKKNDKEHPESRMNTYYQGIHEGFRDITGSRHKRKKFGFNRNAGTAKLEEALKRARALKKTSFFAPGLGYGAHRKNVLTGHKLSGYDFTDEQFDLFTKLMNNDMMKNLMARKFFSSDDIRDAVVLQKSDKGTRLVEAFQIMYNMDKTVGNNSRMRNDADANMLFAISEMLKTTDMMTLKKEVEDALNYEFDFDENILGHRFHKKGKANRNRTSANTFPDFVRGVQKLKYLGGSLSSLGLRERAYYYGIFMQM